MDKEIMMMENRLMREIPHTKGLKKLLKMVELHSVLTMTAY